MQVCHEFVPETAAATGETSAPTTLLKTGT